MINENETELCTEPKSGRGPKDYSVNRYQDVLLPACMSQSYQHRFTSWVDKF